MRLLVLGGTRFVGRHIAMAATAAGHEVTLFNRGSRPDVLPDLPRIAGDRDGGLGALAGHACDAVVDVNGYLPRLVRDAARLLEPTAPRYLFVSTISVYRELDAPFADEDAPLAVLDDPTTEVIDGGSYGALKAACEAEAAAVFGPDRSTVVRPGLVVGPHDPTDRFTYWVRRVARGGPFLAPGTAGDPLQWVDVRDLARFVVALLEADTAGTFNAVRPADAVTLGEFLATVRDVVAARHGEGAHDAEPVWVDESFLAEHGVEPWSDLPAWLPSGANAMLRLSGVRAERAGLVTTPLADTVGSVLAWDEGRGLPPLGAGLGAEREDELLRAWRERQSSSVGASGSSR